MFTRWWTENSSNQGDRKGRRPAGSRGMRAVRSGALLLAGVSLALSGGCALLPPEEQEEVLPTITAPQISKKPEYEVTTATLETKVTANGKLMASREETVFFTLDGKRLKTLNVKVGQQVKAGEVIGTLDVDDLVKALRQKQLAFRKAEVAMKETLRKRDEMDPIDFEQAQIDFESQRQDIADAQEEIAKATITAPFSGTVVSLKVEKGALIKAYDPIATIADTSSLVVTAQMSKDDLAKVAVGMPAVVNVNTAGEFKGKVKQLPMETEGDGGGNGMPGGGNGQNLPEKPENYLQVEIGKLPEGVGRGTPLSVSVIIQRKENAVVIPLAALRTIGARTYVQVVDEQGKREVDVAVGQQTATQAEILEGLKPGQKVVGR